MNKDQKLLQEAYQSIYESSSEPIYLGSEELKSKWMEWLKEQGSKCTINSDGTIDVSGELEMEGDRFLNDPFKVLFPMNALPFQFNIIKGAFDCKDNNLSNLVGAPKIVEGDFICNGNPFKSLKGCSKIVEGSFNCLDHLLVSLEGGPETVGGNFNCSYGPLQSLTFAPKFVGGSFDCSNNRIQSLQGCPEVIKGDFFCSGNSLTSLEGSPRSVQGDFDCYLTNIDSLEGAPLSVKGRFLHERFQDHIYRTFINKVKNKELNKKLSADFDEKSLDALEDF